MLHPGSFKYPDKRFLLGRAVTFFSIQISMIATNLCAVAGLLGWYTEGGEDLTQKSLRRGRRARRIRRGRRRQRVLKGLLLALSIVFLLAFFIELPVNTQNSVQAQSEHGFEVLKDKVRREPENAEARLILGKAYLEAEDFPNAEKELRRASWLGMDDSRVGLLLSQVLYGQGKYKESIKLLEALRFGRADLNAQRSVAMGESLLALGRLERAESAFRAASVTEHSRTAILGLVRIAIIHKQYGRGIELIRSLEEKWGAETEVQILKGQLLLFENRSDQALPVFQQLLVKEPENKDVLLGLARAALLTGDYSLTQQMIDQILSEHTDHPEAVFMRAVMAFENERYGEARNDAELVLLMLPEHLPSVYISGVAYFYQGFYDQAVQRLSRYVSENPEAGHARLLLAAAHQKQQNPHLTVKVLQPLLRNGKEQAVAYALAGNAYLQMGQLQKGVPLLEKALAIMPDEQFITRYLAMGQLLAGQGGKAVEQLAGLREEPQSDLLVLYGYLQQGRIAEAEALVRQRRTAFPDNLSYLLMEAQLNLSVGNLELAHQGYGEILKIDPWHKAALIGMVRLSMQQKNTVLATELLERLLTLEPGHIDGLLARSELARNQGDSRSALLWLSRAQEHNPEEIQPVRAVVRWYLRNSYFEKALKVAKGYYQLNRQRFESVYLYANTLLAVEDFSAANEQLKSLIGLQPDHPGHRLFFADLLVRQGRFEDAHKVLDELLDRSPQFLPASLSQARLLIGVGEFRRAWAIAEEMLERHDDNLQVVRLAGDVKQAQADYPRAVDFYESAYPAVRDEQMVVSMVSAYRRSDGDVRAIAFLDEHLQQFPGDNKARLLRAGLFQQSQQYDLAMADYVKLKELLPENPIIWNNLAMILLTRNDSASLEYARTAYGLAPELPHVKDTLGWILLRYGDASEALLLLQEAAREMSDNPTVNFHLAVALEKNQQPDEAVELLTRISSHEFADVQAARALLASLKKRI